MLFWPIALIALVALLVALLNAHFPDALRVDGASEKLIYLVLLLVGFLVLSFRGRAARLRPVAIMAAGWVAAFSALIVAYAYREEARAVFDRVRGELSPTLAIARAEGEVEIRKGWDGHFRAGARVNGADMSMLIDTGASMVVLKWEDAEAAGLRPETLDFSLPVATANGRGHVAPVTLESVVIGDVGLSRVRAAVAEQGKVKSSLLGMSFLGRLEETRFRGDRLILKN